MEMPKPSQGMLELFASVSPGGPEAIERKMFGQPAAFVGGNMFMGLFGDEFNVRLPAPERAEAMRIGAQPFAPMGRTMKEYVVLPESVLADHVLLSEWVSRAYEGARQLPAKQPKAKKK